VIVNACTHFPLVQDQLTAVLGGRDVRFVDGSAGIARRIAHLTQGQEWPVDAPPGRAVFTRLGEAEYRLKAALTRFGLIQIEAL
jgi:glutamate racemase